VAVSLPPSRFSLLPCSAPVFYYLDTPFVTFKSLRPNPIRAEILSKKDFYLIVGDAFCLSLIYSLLLFYRNSSLDLLDLRVVFFAVWISPVVAQAFSFSIMIC